MRTKRLLNELKLPEQERLRFFSHEKTSTRMKRSIKEMISSYVRADPTEVPTVMHAQETFGRKRIYRIKPRCTRCPQTPFTPYIIKE
ncbi:hypothetical protein ACTXT7_004723 [Hymenolepis weldensis]